MIIKRSRNEARLKRHGRIRNRISGTADCPRLSVFRSNRHMYAQLIDDVAQHTLCSASTMDKELAGGIENKSDVEAAKAIGKAIAARAKDKGITQIVFDRSGYIYHGKVKALAEAAREGGLQF